MTKRQIFGLVSAVVLLLGAFFPIVEFNGILGGTKSVSYFGDNNSYGKLIVLYAIAGIVLAALRQERWIIIPGGIAARHGVPAVVDACFCKLANELAHPGWSYGTDPLGTAITTSVGLLRLLYQSGTAGVMFEVPGNTTVADQGKTGGHVQRGYPSLMGTFQVWERVE